MMLSSVQNLCCLLKREENVSSDTNKSVIFWAQCAIIMNQSFTHSRFIIVIYFSLINYRNETVYKNNELVVILNYALTS